MPLYTIKPTTTNAKAKGQLHMALRGTGVKNLQDAGDEGFRCTIEDTRLAAKFVKFMAEFNTNISPISVHISHGGAGLGDPIDLTAIDIAPPPENPPARPAPPVMSFTGSGLDPVLAPTGAPPPPARQAPAPQPQSLPGATAPHPAQPPGLASPDASADNPYIDPAVIAQAFRPKDAKLSMLAFAPAPLPFRPVYDPDAIRKRAKKLDPRSPEPQRQHIKLGAMGERGYRVSRDKGMPGDRRWVLFAVDPTGVLTRIAEGSEPIAAALCIAAYESADPTNWLAIVQQFYGGKVEMHNPPPPAQPTQPDGPAAPILPAPGES